jgi:hypothetical protein
MGKKEATGSSPSSVHVFKSVGWFMIAFYAIPGCIPGGCFEKTSVKQHRTDLGFAELYCSRAANRKSKSSCSRLANSPKMIDSIPRVVTLNRNRVTLNFLNRDESGW